MLSQLVYVSQRSKSCTAAEIEKILASCKKNNSSLDITGVLLYSEHRFIQLLEGEHKVINNAYDMIKKDHRHNNAMMIYLSSIEEKSFPSWQMGAKEITEDTVDFKTDITSDDKIIFDNILSGKGDDGGKVLNLIKKFF